MAVFQKKGCKKVCVVKLSQKLLQLGLFWKISYSGTFLWQTSCKLLLVSIYHSFKNMGHFWVQKFLKNLIPWGILIKFYRGHYSINSILPAKNEHSRTKIGQIRAKNVFICICFLSNIVSHCIHNVHIKNTFVMCYWQMEY